MCTTRPAGEEVMSYGVSLSIAQRGNPVGDERRLNFFTHVASAQMFLCPQNGRRTVAKALPWLNISVTWEGR